MKYKVGDKVMIVSCEMNPQYVGKIGKVESVLGTDDNALLSLGLKEVSMRLRMQIDSLLKGKSN